MRVKTHGIQMQVLNWIEAWLSERQQRVILNGTKSDWKEVTSGVPQVRYSVLLLFIIFVNEIEHSLESKALKFADDIKVVRVIEESKDQETLQSDLDKLVKWSESWQMKFNLCKCKVMHAGKVNSKHAYKMDGQELSQIEQEKDLGVFIYQKLLSSDQVVEARKRALRMLGAINRNVSYKSEEVITKLYCAYVRPHLEYCVQTWSPIYEEDCWVLERVQKRATKMVKRIKDRSYEERLRNVLAKV